MSTCLQPAARWRRLCAAAIDFVAVLLLALLLALVTGAFEHHEDWVGVRPQVRALGLALLSYLLVNVYFLSAAGQTLGKRFLQISMLARADDSVVALWRYALRALPLCAVAGIFIDPLAFGVVFLLDLLPILGPRRRCLHDYLADTRVVRVGVPPLPRASKAGG